MKHIFTICAKNYFSLALTLGKSVANYEPDARFTIICADGTDGIELNYINPKHRIIDARTLLPTDIFDDMAFKYDVTEFCTSFKPAAFKYIFDTEENIDIVYYMDPDTLLFGSLDPITETEPNKTIYLSPHILDCKIEDNNTVSEYRHLWEGIFNLGFCSIRRTSVSSTILDWWDNRLQQYSYIDYDDGLHTDQKWMDYIVSLFTDDLHVIRHYGVNVAHWNLTERPLTIIDETFYAGKDKLIFFHFSGFDFNGHNLTKHTSKEIQIRIINDAVTSLISNYKKMLLENGYLKIIEFKYGFNNFQDGTVITKLHRRIYRALNLITNGVSPFSTASKAYKAFKESNLIENININSINVRISSSKKDRFFSVLTIILKIFLRIFGLKTYLKIIKLSQWLARHERHSILID